MGTPPLEKNGRDHAQDRAISTLTAEFRQHVSEEMGHHRLIEQSVDRLSAAMEKYIFAGRIAWAFIAILGTIVMVYQASLTRDLNALDARVNALESKQAAFEERGTKWGEQLDDAVQEIRNDIREIRRVINGRRKE